MNRELALSKDILMSVEKPARYIGGEINTIYKDIKDIDIHFAMCFPDVYEIGMSHLGMQILYHMFNKREDTFCERVFSPWVDLDKIMRDNHIPLFTLESQKPVKDCDFLGITLQYEMAYTNILQILELSQIPLHAIDRSKSDPIVIGGGPCAYNPEPIADFFDIFYIGEGEVIYDALLDMYKQYKKDNTDRETFLKKAASLPGIYVPSMYEISYDENGRYKMTTPRYEDIPSTVKKQLVVNLDDAPFIEKPIVPYIKVTQDRSVLEIMRGCIRGCRFCQAGMIYRPLREHSVEYLKKYAVSMLESTGNNEISFSSLSSSDYTYLGQLMDYLIDYTTSRKINISVPSLRIDAFSLDVMSKVQDIKKSSLTFAPEAGTQRLRDVINKGITEEDILDGASKAFRGGWNKVKLYFMIGHPTETTEDREGIANLCEKVARVYYEIPKSERIGKVSISASSSFFVPKPFTPFQWVSMCDKDEYIRRAYEVKDKFKTMLNNKSMRYTYNDAATSMIEGLLARGDRKVARIIESVYKKGALYESWTEYFHPEMWDEAAHDCDIDIADYTTRVRDISEPLPWDFIDIGVSKDFLIREYEKALKAEVSPNCRSGCIGCGARNFGGGVCYEN